MTAFEPRAVEKAEQDILDAVRFLRPTDALEAIKGALHRAEHAAKQYDREISGC